MSCPNSSTSGTIPNMTYNYCSSNACLFTADGTFHCRRNPVNNIPSINYYFINEPCYIVNNSNQLIPGIIDNINVDGTYVVKDLNGAKYTVPQKYLRKKEGHQHQPQPQQRLAAHAIGEEASGAGAASTGGSGAGAGGDVEGFTDSACSVNPAYPQNKQRTVVSVDAAETYANWPFANKSSCNSLPKYICNGKVKHGQHPGDMNCVPIKENTQPCDYNKNCSFNWPLGFTGLRNKQTDPNSCQVISNDGSIIRNSSIRAIRRPDGTVDECCGCNSCGCSSNCSGDCCNSGLLGK